MYKLYDYQLLAVNQLREKMRDYKRVCLCLPTGGGKTIIFSDIANKAIEKGKRVMVCVHRSELKQQAEKTSNATVVMVETLNNQIKAGKIDINLFDLIIIDEVHIGNFRKVLETYDGYVIGATATPVTINKLYPLCNLLNDIVIPISINELIDLGRLSNPKTFARVPDNFKALKKVGGEYSEKSMNEVFNNRQVFNGLITDYKERLINKKGIIFCCSIAHSEVVYNSLIESGVNAFIVHSKMKEREKPVNDFKASNDGVMVNCGILTTGFDEPTIEFVMVNRATTSLALWLQMIGRASRTIENVKNSFEIYDYGMNVHNLGFWQDDRNWNDIFFNVKKKKAEGVAPVKICPNCNAVNNSRATKCEVCEHEFEETIKKEIETKLEELTFKRCLNKYIYDISVSEFMNVAKQKNYKLQYIERILYHVHGINQLHTFWDGRNYKTGYRNRRLQIYSKEAKPLNFKIKL